MSDDALVAGDAALANRVEEERRAGGGRGHFIEDAELRGVRPEQLVAGVVVFLRLPLRRSGRSGERQSGQQGRRPPIENA